MVKLKRALMAAGACALAGCAGDGGSPASAAQGLEIAVLSSRADLVSGGDALIEVRGLDGDGGLTTELNGQPAEALPVAGAPAGAQRLLVSGMTPGRNSLEVRQGGTGATIALTNHPLTGPILSGPHLTPYECRTVESGLGAPTDSDCSAPTRFDWYYLPASVDRSKPVTAAMFRPLPEAGKAPADAAIATTIDGRSVPYIVRVESGVVNRSIYRLAVLDDPRTDGVGAGEGWNGRLAVTFGGGAGTQYNQGVNQATSILSDLYLSRGFAFLNSTELVNQQHGNAVLQGEALMMLKERFIERYGVPKWTVGTGGSGGAIQQLTITQMYPGLLDGLQPSLSYPDSTLNTADCGLFQKFWRSEAGKDWPAEKRQAVEGFTPGTCAAWERSFVPVLTATNKPGCALKDESLVYHPVDNPKGARCTIQEMRVNIYGRDPATGFARKPQDNVGVQYGLRALQSGAISMEDFLELNEGLGGNDIDGGFIAARSVGDVEAIRAVYASGLLNTFSGGIASVPILHSRPYTDAIGDIHDRHRDLTIRARIEKANGRSDNQVIWTAPLSARGPGGPVDLAAVSLDVMTEWLDALTADPAPLSTDKVVRHKPAAAVDAYWTEAGEKVAATADWDPANPYNKAFPLHLEPRLIAGAPVENDVMKCQLRPISAEDYPRPLSVAETDRLKRVFPEGVCDYSRPSIGFSLIEGTYRRY
jgi:hypothetical protein